MGVASPTRIAVVQIAYHPAAVVGGRSPLCDPLFDPKARTSSLAPKEGTTLPEAVRGRLRELGERVREVHNQQIVGKAVSILQACHRWGVSLVVFPEYSLAGDLLPKIAAAAHDMVVVAGTHSVERATLESGLYRDLRCPEPQMPLLGQSVCPVLYRGKIHALQPKLHASPLERGAIALGDRWQPVDLPGEAGIPGPLGTLICLDFLVRQSKAHQQHIAPHLADCTLLAVPSLTGTHTLPEFGAKELEEARRYKRPIAYANIASAGGSTVVADDMLASPFPEGPGSLPAGDEGVLVVDVDLRPGLRGRSRAYDESPLSTTFAKASLVYRTTPVGEDFAAWLSTVHRDLEVIDERDHERLFEILDDVESQRQLLLAAGAIRGAASRRERYATLHDRLKRIQSKEELSRLIREVVVSPEVIPFEHLREAMALGAHDAITQCLSESSDEFGCLPLMEIAYRLKEAGGKIKGAPAETWTEAGRKAICLVQRAVAGPRPASLPLPESHDFELAGLRIHIRPNGNAFHTSLRAPTRHSTWPESALSDAGELRAWLLVDGVSETRLLAVTDMKGQRRSSIHVIGRESDTGTLHLWRVTDAEPMMADEQLPSLLSRLGIGVSGATAHSLNSCRRRLPELLTDLRDRVLADLSARRAAKLVDLEGNYELPDVAVHDADSRTPALAALDEWIDDVPAKLALLLGEFGSGKSTLLTVWAERRWRASTNRLPVLVPLLEARADEGPTELLLRALGCEDTEANQARLGLLVFHRRLIPCFDGIDEVATRIDEKALRARLHELAGCTGPLRHVLVSARDHTFARESELRRTFPDALRLTLVPFSEAQVAHLVGELRGSDAPAILHRLANTYDLADLVRRPLLLGMVLRSLDEIDPGARIGTAGVYEAYIDHWLQGSHVGDAEGLSDDAKMIFAEELADELWRSGAPSCSVSQLRDRVLDVLRDQLLDASGLDSISAFYEIQTGAFFVRESDELFRFAHRSFLEFFLARGLVRHMANEAERRFSTRPFSPEVILFVDQILRRTHGDPLETPSIQGVHRWFVSEAGNARDADRADPRLNALRMLLHLSKLDAIRNRKSTHDLRQWVPMGAQLRGILLPGEDLRYARLSGVDLSGATLCGADLRYASLAGAKLEGCDLRATRLEGVDFSTFDASKADLEHAEDDTQTARLIAEGREGAIVIARTQRPAAVERLSPDLRHVAIATGSWIHVCVSPGGPQIASCLFPAQHVAWSIDGSRIAGISESGAIIVWQVYEEKVNAQYFLDDSARYPELRILREREEIHYFEYFGNSGGPSLLAFAGLEWIDAENLRISTVASTVDLSLTDGRVTSIVYEGADETAFEEPLDGLRVLPDEPHESCCSVRIDTFSDMGISGRWSAERVRGTYYLCADAPGSSVVQRDLSDDLLGISAAERPQQISSPNGHYALEFDQRRGIVQVCSEQGAPLAHFEADWPDAEDFDVSWSIAGDRVFLLEYDLPSSTHSQFHGPYGARILDWVKGSDSFTEFFVRNGSDALLTAIASISDSPPRLLAGDVDGRLRILDGASDARVASVQHTGRVFWVRRAPNGQRVVTADLVDTLVFWSVEPAVIARRRTPAPSALHWSPEGTRLASAHRDRTLRIWSGDGNLLTTFDFHESHWLVHTPGGFFAVDDVDAHLLVGREVFDGDITMIRWRPLGGLRRTLCRPERVSTALRGDLSQDDVGPALREFGWFAEAATSETD